MSTSWAVVTGASGGLGEGFARELGRQGANVVLVARRREEMERIAADLRRAHRVEADVLPSDLSNPDARAQLIEDLAGREVHTLVNNAGFGTLGPFHDLPAHRLSQEVELNVTALTELTRALVPQMRERNRGAVINVASTAGFQPIPGWAVYAASKAYVRSFSHALWAEYRDTGVRVVCISPGPTETDFFSNAGDGARMRNRRTVQDVVDNTFTALRKRRPEVVDGLLNRLTAGANRLVPTTISARLAQQVIKR